jgi:hypothetical protein
MGRMRDFTLWRSGLLHAVRLFQIARCCKEELVLARAEISRLVQNPNLRITSLNTLILNDGSAQSEIFREWLWMARVDARNVHKYLQSIVQSDDLLQPILNTLNSFVIPDDDLESFPEDVGNEREETKEEEVEDIDEDLDFLDFERDSAADSE